MLFDRSLRRTRAIAGPAVAIAAGFFLASCAKDESGRRLTLAEQWKKMADKQDADARAFVNTGTDPTDPTISTRPAETPPL